MKVVTIRSEESTPSEQTGAYIVQREKTHTTYINYIYSKETEKALSSDRLLPEGTRWNLH